MGRKKGPGTDAAFDHSQVEPGVHLATVGTVHFTIESGGSRAPCPDCPATRQDVFDELVGPSRATCAFRCVTLDARATLPDRWFGEYAVGFVRRGVVIRQRVDTQGRASAVDAAGAGCVFPLSEQRGSSVNAGYAATRTLVCLCPVETMAEAIRGPDGTAVDLIRLQNEALDRVERITDARGRGTVQARTAAVLCALADTLSPPRQRNRIPSGLQQRDLAALLGIRHETVCRVLGDLEKKNLLVRENEGIRILDRDGLEAA